MGAGENVERQLEELDAWVGSLVLKVVPALADFCGVPSRPFPWKQHEVGRLPQDRRFLCLQGWHGPQSLGGRHCLSAREGRRVVVVDLDLSAPSQWALFGRTRAPGLVEYVSNWGHRRPLRAGDLVEDIPLDSKASGALYLLQSGRLDKPYLESLQTLDWQELVEMPVCGDASGGICCSA